MRLAAVLLLAGGMQCFAADLRPEEQRGRRIYLQGTGASSTPIVAMLTGGAEVPAPVVPCAGCHGENGQGGQTEGGVTPPDITWAAITKPYSMTSPSGRKYPAYDAAKLRRAITLGLDSAGNNLSPAMPRYRLTLADASDLIAYLRVMGSTSEPGITDSSIRIGAILPANGGTGIADAIRAALTASFEQINQNGGIYSRRIDVRFVSLSPSGERAKAELATFLDREQVFALSSSFIAGAEPVVTSVLKQREIPMIGAMSLAPETSYPLNPYVFYLMPGISEEAQSLANFISEPKAAAILYGREPVFQAAARAIGQRWTRAESIPADGQLSPAVFATLKARRLDAVLCLLPGESTAKLIRNLPGPAFLIPGSLVTQAVLDAIRESRSTAWLAFAELPDDAAKGAVEEYRALAGRYALASSHVATQWTAIAGAKLLIEALQRAGRDVTRRTLISTLESFREVRTGLIPPVSYGPNRRIGILGAHIVSVDPESGKFVPVGKPPGTQPN